MLDMLLIPLIGTLGVAISCAMVGNFVIWNRISYIGDSIAHTSLLGLALGAILSISSLAATIFVVFLSSLALISLHRKLNVGKEALLVLNTQFSLALAMLLFSLFISKNEIQNYFLGNILTITYEDVIMIYAILASLSLFFYICWDKLILISINESIALSEGINTYLYNVINIFLISCLVVFGVKVAGVLLLPSLIVIPAITANIYGKNPKTNLIISVIIATIGTLAGFILTTRVYVSIAPLITLSLISILITGAIYKYKTRNNKNQRLEN